MIASMDSDADLVASARAGDRDAFAAIYDRYADPLHDFTYSVLRDRDEAADATHDTFLIAAQRLGQLREPSKLRPWLYAIARHEALRRARARGREQATDVADLEAASTEPTPEANVGRAETIATVWEAAGGLSARDRALLDLHVRQGLQGQALGDAIGVTAHHADVLMSRLRTQVARSIGALLVARGGRRDCPELEAVLADWDGTFSPLWRKRVARHVDDCDRCSRRRATFLQPMAALAAVGVVPAPLALRARTLGDLGLASARQAADRQSGWGKGAEGGFPPSAFGRSAARRVLVVLAAAVGGLVVVGVVVGVVLGLGSGTTNEPVTTAPTTAPAPAGFGPAPTTAPRRGSTAPPASTTRTSPTTATTKPSGGSTPGSTVPTTQPPPR
jgi:RNA polymerase sigma factor (sigma-70 family)